MQTRPSNPKQGEYVQGWNDKREDNPPISHKGTVALPLCERKEIIKQHIHKLSNNFGRDRRTIRRIVNLWKEGEDLTPQKSPGKKSSRRFKDMVKKIVDDENETYDGCLTYTWIHEQVLNMGYKCSLNKTGFAETII